MIVKCNLQNELYLKFINSQVEDTPKFEKIQDAVQISNILKIQIAVQMGIFQNFWRRAMIDQ